MKRVMRILGVGGLMEAIRQETGCAGQRSCPPNHKPLHFYTAWAQSGRQSSPVRCPLSGTKRTCAVGNREASENTQYRRDYAHASDHCVLPSTAPWVARFPQFWCWVTRRLTPTCRLPSAARKSSRS